MPMVKQPLTVEHALLGFARQGPIHGYEIHQRLLESAELGLVWSIKQSLLYAHLARLEEEGLLTSTVEQRGDKPARKILQVTAAGEEAFQRWVRSPVEHGRDVRIEFLAKLFFARAEGTPVALELVARQRRTTVQRLGEMRARADEVADGGSFDWLVLRYRIGQIEALLAWLDLCADWAIVGESAPPPAG